MFEFLKSKKVPEEVKQETLSVGMATRTASNPKFIDNSGKEHTLSTHTAPSSEQAIATSDVIFTCASFISDSIAQVRFTPYMLDSSSINKVPFSNKAILKVFSTNPTPTSSWTELLGTISTQILLDGEAFITVEVIAGNFEFTAIDSATSVEILFDVEHPEIPTGYKIAGVEYNLDEIIHIKRINLTTSLHGQSVIASLIDAMVLDGYASNDLISLYENGSVGELYLHSEMPLASSQVEQIEQKLANKYSRAGRHNTFVLPNGLEPKSLKINPKDAVILEAMGISEDRILRAFKLHKSVLGGDILSYTNDIAGLTSVQFNNAVRPMVNMIKDRFEMFMRTKLKKPNFYLEVNYDNLPEISRALTIHVEKARLIYSSGLGSLNEARDIIGLPPLTAPLANENFLPEFLHGSSLMSVQGLDAKQLAIIREAKVAEAQNIVDGEETVTPNDKPTEPKGSDDPEGGVPNNMKEEK